MRTSGTTDEVALPLTKKQKGVCNIVMGALLITAGVILALAGGGVINVSAGRIAAPTLLFAFGISIFISAVIAKNSLSIWIAGVILSCGLTSLLEVTTAAGYKELFPLYIAAPGIGCVLAMLFAQSLLPLLKAVLFFGAFAIVFALGASGVCGWGLTAGLAAAVLGVYVTVYAVIKFTGKDEEENA